MGSSAGAGADGHFGASAGTPLALPSDGVEEDGGSGHLKPNQLKGGETECHEETEPDRWGWGL